MKTFAFARALLAAAVVTATGSAALAQPGAPDAPQPPAPAPAAPVAPAAPATNPTAPVNADWNQVNHINGQLVPVGQKNDYLIKFRKTNISTNPLGWVFGSYGVSVSYALNDHIAVTGSVSYFSPSYGGGSAQGAEISAAAPIYFRRTYQGLFLEPGIVSRTFKDSYTFYDSNNNPTTSSTTTTTFGPEVLVGWHWTWDSGLNFSVAAGAGRNWATKNTDSSYAGNDIFANGYMRFGYAF
jgi:hypothetical protein